MQEPWTDSWRCPDELVDYFAGAKEGGHGSDRIVERTPQQELLHAQALLHATSQGWDDHESELFATSMVRRAKDASRQESAWLTTEADYRDQLRKSLQCVLDEGAVCVAARFPAATSILATGRFATQFETGTSGALLDPSLRAMGEWAAFNLPPSQEPHHRPVYGFVAMPGRASQKSVDQYGPVRFVLTEEAAHRSTLTIGDSLNWHARPVSVRSKASARHASDACARRGEADWGRILVTEGLDHFQDLCYFEAQIHGGVTLTDIRHIEIARAPQQVPDDRRIPFESAAHSAGIRVNWNPISA